MVRTKVRYILIQAIPIRAGVTIDVPMNEMGALINSGVSKLYGLYGVALNKGMSIVYNNLQGTGVCIVKCRREAAEMLKTTLPYFSTKTMPFPYALNIIHIGGTLRSTKRHAIKFNNHIKPSDFQE